MANLGDLYDHLKTLCEQWFYTKDEIDIMAGISWNTFFNYLDCVNTNFDDISNDNYTLLQQ